MSLPVLALGLLLLLVALVCNLIVIVHALRSSMAQGFLAIFVPFYVLVYLFTRFEHRSRGLIAAGSLVGGVLGAILVSAALGLGG
ncbi:MAG: hypothetical protein ACFCGT_07670 [Sandaracinaceae bacterium]